MSLLNANNHYGDEYRVCKSCWDTYLQGNSSLMVNLTSTEEDDPVDSAPASKGSHPKLGKLPGSVIAAPKKSRIRLFG
ncbi:MAG: hypothetical protein KAG18_04150 [Sinobacterium sp.]|nr:hypothetical protein [Sinobacterium sp.]